MKLTSEGKRFVVATVLIAIVAFNTANNLIYLILSMMSSILLLSILILNYNLWGLILKVSYKHPIFARSSSTIKITISNKKKIMPSYSVRVLLTEKMNTEVYFPVISCLSNIKKEAIVTFDKRGRYRYGDFIIESSFPFIFFTKRILCNIEGEIIVYPEIKNVDWAIPSFINTYYENLQKGLSKGEEFFMIREFRYGDDWRKIHWKASAKTTQFMVKEYSSHEPKKVTIILDNLKPFDTDLFEKSVSIAASLTETFINEGIFVRLFSCNKMIPFGCSKEHLYKILDILAEIQGMDSWECPVSSELDGMIILILNSDESSLKRFAHRSELVIYASNL